MRRKSFMRTFSAELLGVISALVMASSSAMAQSTPPDAQPTMAKVNAPATLAPTAATAAAPAATSTTASPDAAEARRTRPDQLAPPPALIRYSNRKKGGINGAPGRAASAVAGQPDQGEVVCTAGCDKLPGQVVHVRENVPSSPDLAEANAATGKMPAADIGCLAGCDTAAHRFAGISSGVESSHVTTQGRFPPAAKPGSGDWLVRINRERSPEQRP